MKERKKICWGGGAKVLQRILGGQIELDVKNIVGSLHDILVFLRGEFLPLPRHLSPRSRLYRLVVDEESNQDSYVGLVESK